MAAWHTKGTGKPTDYLTPLEVGTDSDGVVGLPPGTGAPVLIQASFPGHCSTTTILKEGGNYDVFMPPAASVEVKIIASDDSVGQECAILLPEEFAELESVPIKRLRAITQALTSGSPGDASNVRARDLDDVTGKSLTWLTSGLRRVTDEQGRAFWAEVPAGEGYRWALKGSNALAIQPPHELSAEARGGVLLRGVEGLVPPGVSGVFDLRAGEHRRFVVDGSQLAQLIAVIPEYDPSFSDALMEVYDEGPTMGKDGRTGWKRVSMGRFPPDEEGVILVEGVRSGLKSYVAHWKTGGGNRLTWVNGTLQLQPGEVKTVYLDPKGYEATAVVRVLDASTGGEAQVEGYLTCTLIAGDDVDYKDRFLDRFRLRPGVEFTGVGLSPGTYRFKVDASSLVLQHGQVVNPTRLELEWSVPGGDLRGELVSVFRTETAVTLTLPSQDADSFVDETEGQGKIRLLAEGELFSAACTYWPSMSKSELQGFLLAPSGEWPCIAMATVDGRSYAWKGRLAVGGSQARINLEPAFAVEGVASDGTGPLGPGGLMITIREDEWTTAEGDQCPFQVPLDGDGEFLIPSVPPGTTLVFENGSQITLPATEPRKWNAGEVIVR